MFTITKRFEFSASHQLDGLPDDHPCSSRRHPEDSDGSYTVTDVYNAAELALLSYARRAGPQD